MPIAPMRSLIVAMCHVFLPECKDDLRQLRLLLLPPVDHVRSVIEHAVVVLQQRLGGRARVERAELLAARVEERQWPVPVAPFELHLECE